MILSTGRKNLNSKKGYTPTPTFAKVHKLKLVWGYTLVELLLTTIIVLVIVGLSIPIFRRTFSDLQVNLNAKDMASLINLARERAIMTRIPHTIEIDTYKKIYRILIMDTEKAKMVPIKGKWGRRFYILSRLKVTSSDDTIKFFADGSSTGGYILFEDVSGLKNQIRINAGTGEIDVEKIK